ncbi:ABC transporter permease [Conexibacter sp. DBS9H8]|uniref:ABC transporter permease n=1 Tax=Conexibacter sp. DBS9H8 TaxID=2937801 RepID=UPI00200F4583|nr:ABC transporter permease [Conexibacter sp. DBS9H8]
MLSYRFLFTQLVRRELRQKYKGSALGILWYLVNPLVMMGAYTLMFGAILKVARVPDYPLFLMVGLSVWTFFQTSLTAAADSLILQGSLVRKARFPREAIPAATVTVQLVTLAAVLLPVALITLVIRGSWTPWLVLVPVFIVCLYGFVLGLALAVSVLHAYFRDVLPIIQAGLLPLFFLTPIYFETSKFSFVHRHPWVGTVLNWVNPIAPFLEGLRAIIYGGSGPGLGRILYGLVAAAVSLTVGRILFDRLQGELAVVL